MEAERYGERERERKRERERERSMLNIASLIPDGLLCQLRLILCRLAIHIWLITINAPSYPAPTSLTPNEIH